jgi:PAS domain S-box-containing protein
MTARHPGRNDADLTHDIGAMLVESSPDALIALASDDTILFWSKGAETIFGYTKEEAIGCALYDLVVPPELVKASRESTHEALELGSTVYESLRHRKDGSVVYVDITSKSVRGLDGELKFVAVSQKDVTQVKALQHGRVLESRYRGLLETVPEAIVMVNNTGRIVLVNGQSEQLFGYKREELLGQAIEILLPRGFPGGHVSHRTKYFTEPRAHTMGAGLELFACRKDGTEFAVEISLSPIETEDGVLVTSSIRDITDRKRLEEQLRSQNEALEVQNQLIEGASRMKSEFLANMSHELRTPLNGIIGFTELMHDGKVGPVASNHKEYLEDILTSARHLLQLINDVLDLSKIEPGKMEFNPEPVVVTTLVVEVCEIVRPLAAKKRISIVREIDNSLNLVQADARSLKQILYNYLSNAVKFTPDEGVVTVRVKSHEADDFRIEVEDTGIGIRAEDIKRLFVEFQQLDPTAAKKSSGTGLGLALTKRLVEAQGGKVGVRSTPDKGSVFHAVLPRTIVHPATGIAKRRGISEAKTI